MKLLKTVSVCISMVMAAGYASAEDNLNSIYGGLGQVANSLSENQTTPFSFGMMRQFPNEKLILGFDIAGEGIHRDYTYGQDGAVSQSTSINFLIGANIAENGSFKLDAAALIGFMDDESYCAQDSVLGLQCYAGADPINTYKANLGAVVTFSVNSLMLGVRMTGESQQVMIGLRF